MPNQSYVQAIYTRNEDEDEPRHIADFSIDGYDIVRLRTPDGRILYQKPIKTHVLAMISHQMTTYQRRATP